MIFVTLPKNDVDGKISILTPSVWFLRSFRLLTHLQKMEKSEELRTAILEFYKPLFLGYETMLENVTKSLDMYADLPNLDKYLVGLGLVLDNSSSGGDILVCAFALFEADAKYTALSLLHQLCAEYDCLCTRFTYNKQPVIDALVSKFGLPAAIPCPVLTLRKPTVYKFTRQPNRATNNDRQTFETPYNKTGCLSRVYYVELACTADHQICVKAIILEYVSANDARVKVGFERFAFNGGERSLGIQQDIWRELNGWQSWRHKDAYREVDKETRDLCYAALGFCPIMPRRFFKLIEGPKLAEIN